MESQVARRMNKIMGHFAGNEDVPASHVFPVNCSSSANSVIRRCDNRMFFARQGTVSQGFFMRQVSTKQNFGQGSSVQSGVPLCCSGSVNADSTFRVTEAPMFSRPVRKEPNLPNIVEQQTMKKDCKLTAIEGLMFARPNRGLSGQKKNFSKKKIDTSRSKGIEWSPRMDVAEFGCNHVVTVELPGISINDIRVEVDDQNLTVTGKRSTQRWRVTSGSEDSVSAYHRREILQGPYQVVWPLPNDVNRDSVSAVFVDGFLQITLPKRSCFFDGRRKT